MAAIAVTAPLFLSTCSICMKWRDLLCIQLYFPPVMLPCAVFAFLSVTLCQSTRSLPSFPQFTRAQPILENLELLNRIQRCEQIEILDGRYKFKVGTPCLPTVICPLLIRVYIIFSIAS